MLPADFLGALGADDAPPTRDSDLVQHVRNYSGPQLRRKEPSTLLWTLRLVSRRYIKELNLGHHNKLTLKGRVKVEAANGTGLDIDYYAQQIADPCHVDIC